MPFKFIYKLFMTRNSNPDKRLYMSNDWVNRNQNKINSIKGRLNPRGR